MIIVITPFIENKAEYRSYDLRRDKANTKVNLAEPCWYSNNHFNVLSLMYGGRAGNRPDILDLEDLPAIERHLADHYCDFELVHVPYDLHLDVDAIHDIVRNRLFLKYPPLSKNHLGQPFIKAEQTYFRIPVAVVDANDPECSHAGEPVIRFREDNGIEEINDYVSRAKAPRKSPTEQVLAMPIGGWCGAAEALKSLGLRKEAYPFDYLRTDLSLIVELLNTEQLSPARVSELLFDQSPNARAEFVHHKLDDASTRETFVNRTLRFVERIKESGRPMLFVRVTHSNPDLETELRRSREMLAVADKHRPDKRDKLVLIANFHDEPTGKAAILNDGRIMVWNAMGAFGWKVPNNWHVITDFAKIIAHELHYFHQGSPINYTRGIIPIVARAR